MIAVLVTLLNEAGLRIGEALGLRHEDVRTADGVVDVRARDNANGARAKPWERQVPVSTAWFLLHAEYLHREYGDLDSDYLFVGLWSRPVGRPLSYSAVADLFARLSRTAGVVATPHMLRHTYATRLLRAGVPQLPIDDTNRPSPAPAQPCVSSKHPASSSPTPRSPPPRRSAGDGSTASPTSERR